MSLASRAGPISDLVVNPVALQSVNQRIAGDPDKAYQPTANLADYMYTRCNLEIIRRLEQIAKINFIFTL